MKLRHTFGVWLIPFVLSLAACAVDQKVAIDEERARVIQRDGAAKVVPAGAELVDSSSVGPCEASYADAHIIRVFRATTATDVVLADIQRQLTGLGWRLVEDKRPPKSDFAGEALFEKDLGGWIGEAKVLSFIEASAAPHGVPSGGWNLEIDITASSVRDCEL